jgi:hypothetical protein
MEMGELWGCRQIVNALNFSMRAIALSVVQPLNVNNGTMSDNYK